MTSYKPTLRECSLPEYRGHVGGLARPSAEQIHDFVQFVCEARHWYRHLPLFPPGVPFHFFLDPCSGYDGAVLAEGGIEVYERTETSQFPSHPWITTKEYRHRFGYLNYGAAAGPYFSVRSEKFRECTTREVYYTTDQYFVPPEVADTGSVELTAVIHPAARSSLRTWAIMLSNHAGRYSERHPEQWPLESGGEATLRQIGELLDCAVAHTMRWKETAKQLEAPEIDKRGLELQPHAPVLESQHLQDGMDAHLHAQIHRLEEKLDPLVRPEARRLQAKMTEAINRMLALVFDLAG